MNIRAELPKSGSAFFFEAMRERQVRDIFPFVVLGHRRLWFAVFDEWTMSFEIVLLLSAQ